jgi:hypothetical protein
MTAQAHAKCGCLISTYGIETWVARLVVRLLCADWDVGTGPLEKSNQPYSHVLGTRAGRVLFSETRALAEMERRKNKSAHNSAEGVSGCWRRTALGAIPPGPSISIQVENMIFVV